MLELKDGAEFVVPYPFFREEVELPPDDPEAMRANTVMSWRPGVRAEIMDNLGDTAEFADGMGEMRLTVVSVHKPGRYPTRVFYTRQWRDPDGKLFGKAKLRMTTQQAFRRLCAGYRHEFFLDGELREAA